MNWAYFAGFSFTLARTALNSTAALSISTMPEATFLAWSYMRHVIMSAPRSFSASTPVNPRSARCPMIVSLLRWSLLYPPERKKYEFKTSTLILIVCMHNHNTVFCTVHWLYISINTQGLICTFRTTTSTSTLTIT